MGNDTAAKLREVLGRIANKAQYIHDIAIEAAANVETDAQTEPITDHSFAMGFLNQLNQYAEEFEEHFLPAENE